MALSQLHPGMTRTINCSEAWLDPWQHRRIAEFYGWDAVVTLEARHGAVGLRSAAELGPTLPAAVVPEEAMMRHGSDNSVPFVTLRQAIDRTSNLFGGATPNSISTNHAIEHLGYGGNRAAGQRLIAALIAYGLVERKSGNKLAITALASRILEPANQFDHDAALVDAADSPPLFRAARNYFDGRPLAREELRHWLRRRGLEKSLIEEVIDLFCKTSKFVRVPQQRMVDVIAAVAARQAHEAGSGAASSAIDRDLETTDLAWE
jgi:hypothetical protein